MTHVDYSARIQTVHKETNPKYYELLKKFKEITGCPLLVNTSFNIRGEPIVCSVKMLLNVLWEQILTFWYAKTIFCLRKNKIKN